MIKAYHIQVQLKDKGDQPMRDTSWESKSTRNLFLKRSAGLCLLGRTGVNLGAKGGVTNEKSCLTARGTVSGNWREEIVPVRKVLKTNWRIGCAEFVIMKIVTAWGFCEDWSQSEGGKKAG